MEKLNSTPIDEVVQICWLLLGLRPACSTHKNRNDRGFPLEG